MKYRTTIATMAVATMALASTAYADDFSSGFEGGFEGSVSSFAESGGVSATGSMGGFQNSRIRNESGSGEFAGASMSWEAEDGFVSMGAESFTDGFDFSKTNAGGGYGGSFADRYGAAQSQGGFTGGFSGGDFDGASNGGFGGGFGNGEFPGLGLGHGGFDDGTPGNND